MHNAVEVDLVAFLRAHRARSEDLCALGALGEGGGVEDLVVAVGEVDRSGRLVEVATLPTQPFGGLVGGQVAPRGAAVVFLERARFRRDGEPGESARAVLAVPGRRQQPARVEYASEALRARRCDLIGLPSPAAQLFGALVLRRVGAHVAPPPALLAGEVLGAIWLGHAAKFEAIYGGPVLKNAVQGTDPFVILGRELGEVDWEDVARYVAETPLPLGAGGADLRPHLDWLGAGALGWVLLGTHPSAGVLARSAEAVLDGPAAAWYFACLRERQWWPRR